MVRLGLTVWVDAACFNIVTMLTGCEPGFLYRFIDALAGAVRQRAP